jgi:hypothetical protein
MGNLEQDAIRRILAGDRDAFRVLMDHHLPAVLRMTYRVTGNAVDAEEAPPACTRSDPAGMRNAIAHRPRTHHSQPMLRHTHATSP